MRIENVFSIISLLALSCPIALPNPKREIDLNKNGMYIHYYNTDLLSIDSDSASLQQGIYY